MEKVCINDFSPSELHTWMKEFYPNGLNRANLEKASNSANIRYFLRKRHFLERVDMLGFSKEEKARFNVEKMKLGRIANDYKEAESEFMIVRSRYKKNKFNKNCSAEEIKAKLKCAFKGYNFDDEILKPEY
ncbi:hypothetical protein [Flavicella sp.]|uniref:hypothetical protein n=1 Tax=Flavicella sp. TaxID=2957742 RepID=UPI00301634E9